MQLNRALRTVAALAVAGAAVAVGVGAAPAHAATGNPPVVAIVAPYDGEVFEPGATGVAATLDFVCQDADLVSCVGNVPNGTLLDTSLGAHVITVTATDAEGSTASKTITYYGANTQYTCSAAIARIGKAAIAGSNVAGTPCVQEETQGFDTYRTLGPVVPALFGGIFPRLVITGAYSGTGPYGGSTYLAAAQLYNPETRLYIELTGVSAHVAATPIGAACTPRFEGATSVAGLSMSNATTQFDLGSLGPITGPLTIPLGIGTLNLNQTSVVGHTAMYRAVFLDLPGTAMDVALGEATAGVTC